MASVNGTSVREEFAAAKARIATLRRAGKVSEEVDAVLSVMFTMMDLLITVLLEKKTPKTSGNSGIPPSQAGQDETARRASPGDGGTGAKAKLRTGANLQKTTIEETVTVEACDACGADLSDRDPVERERRTLYDIEFQLVERHVDAEIKQCPACQARTKAPFPDTMPGPRQYGIGRPEPPDHTKALVGRKHRFEASPAIPAPLIVNLAEGTHDPSPRLPAAGINQLVLHQPVPALVQLLDHRSQQGAARPVLRRGKLLLKRRRADPVSRGRQRRRKHLRAQLRQNGVRPRDKRRTRASGLGGRNRQNTHVSAPG